MNIQHIYKGLFLTLLLLAISIQVSAQCTINLTLNTKNTNCGDDGAVEAVISNLDQLTTLTYEVENSGGTAITPPGTVSPLITGLAPGNYTLTVNGFCKAGGAAVTENKPFTIITGTITGNVFKAGLNTAVGKYRHTSLNNINTGKIAFDITGGSGQYILELINPPVAYTGNTQFIVGAPGYFAVDHLPAGTYQIKISDGDCENILFSQLVIKAVANADDLPANKAELFNSTSQYVYPKANSSYPTEEYKKLRFSLFTGLNGQGFATQTDPSKPVNLNDYYNKVDAPDYYEFGLAYGTDPSQVTTWNPLKYSASHLFDDAIHPYSKILGNDFEDFIPNMFVRLKDKPSVSKVYTTYIDRYIVRGKEVSMTQNGFRVKILASAHRWWSYPCQLVAENSMTGEKKTIVATQNNDFPLVIDLDWGTGKWNLYLEGLPAGDKDYKLSVGWVYLDTKQNFIDKLDCSKVIQIDANARPSGYGNTNMTVNLDASKLDIDIPSEFRFPRLKARIDPNPNFPNGLGPEYTTNNSKSIILTGYGFLPIAEGNYTITVEMYDVDNNLAATKVLDEVKIPDRGTMAAIDGASLTVNQILADACYSRKISLDLDNIKSLFELRLRNSTKTMTNVRIQIFKMKPNGTDADPATGVMTSNFTINYSENYRCAYNFSISDIESSYYSTWRAGSDRKKPEFIISETGTFVVVATPIFNYRNHLITGSHSYGGQGLSNLISWSSIINDSYWHVKSSFTLDVNDMTKVRFDAEKTNGFRCSPTDIGTLNIGIESSSLPTAIMKYTVTSMDKLGNPTPYTKNESTTDREITWNDVPADVKFLKVSVETDDCINQPTVYTVQMYSLDNPAYLSSEGGYECINGTTTHTPTDLKLKAVAILGTTYQWYYPDGTEVPSAAPYNGNTANATIPAAEIQLGDYSCAVLNPICGSTTYTHKIKITDLGGDVFYWAVDAANSDWNDPANWRTWRGEVAPRIPDACTDVVIPGKVTAFYPDLQASLTTGTAVCRTIIFRYGGQVYHTERLTYIGAQIEYNANYYDPLPTDDRTPTQPATNEDEGIQPESDGVAINGLPTINRNRWCMIAAPLKDIVSGDFQLDGKPNTFSALYDKKQDVHTSFISKGDNADKEYITVVNDNTMKLNDTHNAMLIWIPAFTYTVGGMQDALQASTGKIIYPTANSTFTEYDMRTLALDGATHTVTRTKPNRFVYENANDQPGTQYQLQINADANRTDGLVMIGNPFMGTIDLQSFHTANSALIENSFKILTSAGWQDFTSGAADAHIAPLQGFVIKLKNPLGAATLNFPYTTIYSPMAVGSQIKPK